MKLNGALVSIAALLFLAAPPRVALAHRMLADSFVGEDGSVRIEAFFPDGTPARGAEVEIFSPGGESRARGVAGDDGLFLFGAGDKRGTWRAVVTGIIGHRAETEFTIPWAGGKPAPGAGPRGVAKNASRGRRVAPRDGLIWVRIVSGVGFILALASFIMVIGLRRELRRKEDASSGNR